MLTNMHPCRRDVDGLRALWASVMAQPWPAFVTVMNDRCASDGNKEKQNALSMMT
jgi:hypothetical protein